MNAVVRNLFKRMLLERMWMFTDGVCRHGYFVPFLYTFDRMYTAIGVSIWLLINELGQFDFCFYFDLVRVKVL